MLASDRSLYSYAFISLLACSGAGGEQALQGPRPVSNAQEVVSLSTDKEIYAAEDVIELTLELENNSDQPLMLNFSTGQRYEFTISKPPGETVWSWSEERMFMQMLGQETVGPNQVLAYHEQISPELSAGTYTVTGRIVAQNETLVASVTIVVQ